MTSAVLQQVRRNDMDELSLGPALAIRRALRFSPALACGALLATAGIGIEKSPTVSELLAWAATTLAALGVLLFALVRLAVRRPIRLFIAVEAITATCLCFGLIVFGVVSLHAPTDAGVPAGSPLSGLLLLIGCVGIVYSFMYPWRASAPAPLTVSQLLGGVRPGPFQSLEHGWWWLAALLASVVLTGVAIDMVAIDSDHGVRVLAAVLASVGLMHAILPALIPALGSQGTRTLRDVREARKKRRNGSYPWYVLRTADDLGPARRHLALSVIFIAAAFLLLVSGGRLAQLSTLVAVFSYIRYREAISVIARDMPETERQRIEDSGVFTLYLRSFNDDDFRFDLSVGIRRFLLLPFYGGLYAETFGSSRLEELVVRALWRYRPVVGVAGPEAPANPIGAIPVRLTDATWKEGVLMRAKTGQTIVSVVAGTPGAVWESQVLLADPDCRRRLVFLLPQEDAAGVTRRWGECLGPLIDKDADVVGRAIVAKPHAGGRMTMITSPTRSREAYVMALDLAEGLVTREVG